VRYRKKTFDQIPWRNRKKDEIKKGRKARNRFHPRKLYDVDMVAQNRMSNNARQNSEESNKFRWQ
jgi:hypothetical protein